MTNILIILIILACLVLSFFILIQKPKGGGLSGAFGSIGTQVMGAKQSGDVMEKGTWVTICIIGALCIGVVFTLDIRKPAKEVADPVQKEQKANTNEKTAPTPAN